MTCELYAITGVVAGLLTGLSLMFTLIALFGEDEGFIGGLLLLASFFLGAVFKVAMDAHTLAGCP